MLVQERGKHARERHMQSLLYLYHIEIPGQCDHALMENVVKAFCSCSHLQHSMFVYRASTINLYMSLTSFLLVTVLEFEGTREGDTTAALQTPLTAPPPACAISKSQQHVMHSLSSLPLVTLLPISLQSCHSHCQPDFSISNVH